ncbi:uncharacterized protein J3R85_016507 [Psidium guajava]|nr:uncharacterized protein J3R85_016507 [Psidium guajava]
MYHDVVLVRPALVQAVMLHGLSKSGSGRCPLAWMLHSDPPYFKCSLSMFSISLFAIDLFLV